MRSKCSAENLTLTALANNQLSGYGYDAAGNMISDPTDGVSASYDAENRIASASTPQGAFAYTYDADGNRVEKSGGGTGTLYWYMTPGIVAESDLAGNLQWEYVFFNGERVARRDNPSSPGATVVYYFSDHLKPASVITDSTGNIKAESGLPRLRSGFRLRAPATLTPAQRLNLGRRAAVRQQRLQPLQVHGQRTRLRIRPRLLRCALLLERAGPVHQR